MNSRGARLAMSLVSSMSIIMVLAACGVGPEVDAGTKLKNQFGSDVVVRELESDDAGSYLVVATAAVKGDDGYVLELEERFYPDMKSSRFLVAQEGLAQRNSTRTVASMSLAITRDDSEILVQDLTMQVADDRPQFSYTTELVPTFLASPGAEGRACAALYVEYGTAGITPHVLSTCDSRSLSLATD